MKTNQTNQTNQTILDFNDFLPKNYFDDCNSLFDVEDKVFQDISNLLIHRSEILDNAYFLDGSPVDNTLKALKEKKKISKKDIKLIIENEDLLDLLREEIVLSYRDAYISAYLNEYMQKFKNILIERVQETIDNIEKFLYKELKINEIDFNFDFNFNTPEPEDEKIVIYYNCSKENFKLLNKEIKNYYDLDFDFEDINELLNYIIFDLETIRIISDNDIEHIDYYGTLGAVDDDFFIETFIDSSDFVCSFEEHKKKEKSKINNINNLQIETIKAFEGIDDYLKKYFYQDKEKKILEFLKKFERQKKSILSLLNNYNDNNYNDNNYNDNNYNDNNDNKTAF